jgi:hypothetical protein
VKSAVSITSRTHTPTPETPNRREFLSYVGGASLVLLAAGSCGLLARFLNGPTNGIYRVDLGKIPLPEKNPIGIPQGQYWLVNTSNGLLALDGHCTFWRDINRKEKLPRWVPFNHRFECPICGSKYQLSG